MKSGVLAQSQVIASVAEINGLKNSSLEAQLDADTKDLGDDKSLATTHHDCLTVAADHKASIRARSEELKVIATAKKILEESTGGASLPSLHPRSAL